MTNMLITAEPRTLMLSYGARGAAGEDIDPFASGLDTGRTACPIAGAGLARNRESNMLCFSAAGRLGRIDRLKSKRLMLRLSVACDRLVDGPSGKWTKTEWLSAVCFDSEICARLKEQCSVGDRIQLTGRIEPRRRAIGETTVYDYSFIIETARVIAPLKTSAKVQAA